MLHELRVARKISDVVVQEQKDAFPTQADKERLFEALREFALKHGVGLARAFGSRRYGFWYLPPQFLLVHADAALREVFPCRSVGSEIGVAEFLEKLAKGEAWTTSSVAYRGEGRHAALLERIAKRPELLERRLTLIERNVQVSREFGERGYVDLVFQHEDGSYLLVEIKSRSDELDKAIGQILKQRELFAAQNAIDKSRVRPGIACPLVPPQYRKLCEEVGISWFEIRSDGYSAERSGVG